MIENEEQAREFVAERCSAESFDLLDWFVTELLAEAENQNLISRSTID